MTVFNCTWFLIILKESVKIRVIFWMYMTLIDSFKGLGAMTSNPVTSLAWVRSPGDALVV
jgi:hypothetical protein